MDKKVKVMQIIPAFVLGGAEIMVENLSVALTKEGLDVNVVSLYNYKSAITERLEDKGIPVFYLNKKKGPDLGIIVQLYKLLKQQKPDIVHTHLYTIPYTLIAAKMAGVHVSIHTIHSIADKEASKIKRKINFLFYKYFGVIPVAISPQVKKSILDEYSFLNSQVPMIYNGIDLDNCMPKQKYEAKKDIINILHVGSFKEAKNHLGLIDSFKIVNDTVPNTILNLIGSGNLEKTIKDSIIELGLEDNINILGTQSDVHPFLKEADIFVLPSLWEGMPMSLIEAMGSGLPVVVTNVGGIPDMVENNISGLIVEVDKIRIADALLKLVNNEKLRRELGQAAKNKSTQFSASKMARDYMKLYLSMLK